MKVAPSIIPLWLFIISTPLLVQSFANGQDATENRIIKKTITAPSTTKKSTKRIDDSGPTINEQSTVDYTRPSGTGLSIFVGADGGYVSSSPLDPSRESEKSGFHLAAKGLASVFTNAMVVDFGGGFLSSSLSGAKDTLSAADGSEQTLEDVEIQTNIGFLEFSPRFRLSSGFSLGLLGQGFFGEDGRFGPETPLDDPDSGKSVANVATVFGGGSAIYQWDWESVSSRFGALFLTDVNIIDRQLYIAQLTLQVGIPVVKQKTIVETRKIHNVKTKVREERVNKVFTEVVVKEIVRFQFDSQFINFATGEAKLSPRSYEFLRRIASFLAQNTELWESVVIEGHTDTRGSFDYNMNLSRLRAASVRQVLIENGVPEDRTQSSGYGFTRPIDRNTSPVALARNRRVEMSFTNVSDPSYLRQGIANIRRQIMSIP